MEEAIFAGVPVNVTLLFSREHYLAAAGAFLCGIERRIAAGLKPKVGSVASMSVSRWDAAVMDRVPDPLRNKLGVAIARRTYKAYRELLSSPRWQQRAQRRCPAAEPAVGRHGNRGSGTSDDFYIRALTAPFSIITMSESTLKALADRGDIGMSMPADGGGCEAVLGCFAKAGIDIDALSAELQDEDAAAGQILDRADVGNRYQRAPLSCKFTTDGPSDGVHSEKPMQPPKRLEAR